VGAGRTELCRAIFGVDAIASGQVFLDGKAVRIRSPREAVGNGLALIPEDRQRSGLATALPISWNTTMASLSSLGNYGWLDLAAQRKVTESYREKLRLKCSSIDQLAGRLSGGNQQKVVIAKWLATGARVFLFDEPTRGIDIGAKAEVFEVMDELARNGAAILMVSSELPEIIQIADRILVMRQGRLSGELPRHSSQESVMRLAAFEKESGLLPDIEESLN
jgi:ABC-type sugar transport system ATPase subunit